MEISNFILAIGLGFLWHGLQIFWVSGLPRQLKGSNQETSNGDIQKSFMLFWLDQYSWIGPVSYTHLTLPTNREV